MNPDTLSFFLSFVFGTCIGSFLNVVIWRLPRQEVLTGRSHCAFCQHQLSAADLVPVLSFFALRGRCQYCKEKISWRYAVIEVLTGALFAFSFWFWQPVSSGQWLGFLYTLLGLSILIVIFVIDLEHYLILDSVVLFGLIASLTLKLLAVFLGETSLTTQTGSILNSLLSGIGASLPFFAIWFLSKGKWMGFGDVKFLLFLGVFLGWPLIAASVFLAVMLGGVLSVILLLLGAKSLKSRLPFGTFLAVGAVVALFCGQSLLAWYLGILGF